MRPFWLLGSLGFLCGALTACSGSSLSQATPASDLTKSSTQSRQLPSVLDPLSAAKKVEFVDVHDFGASGDGSVPYGGLALDTKGLAYGTTVVGGANGHGSVYRIRKISPAGVVTTLYSFQGGSDGANPYGTPLVQSVQSKRRNVTVTMLGTTYGGGAGYGTVFQISINSKGQATETVLYSFADGADGAYPMGNLIMDAGGNLYGLTSGGGTFGYGTAFKLTRSGSGYIESVLYTFTGGGDGGSPEAGLVADANGNLFGTTQGGGGVACAGGCGTVFELTPTSSGYSESVPYSFQGPSSGPDGASPLSDLTIDGNGNLYGTTFVGGSNGAGSVFEVHPATSGATTEKILYSFQGGSDGSNPASCPFMDANGNLWGTAFDGGTSRLGTAYSLSPGSGGTWSFALEHTFTGGSKDGANPYAGLLVGSNGSFVGTTTGGGASNDGIAYRGGPKLMGVPIKARC